MGAKKSEKTIDFGTGTSKHDYFCLHSPLLLFWRPIPVLKIAYKIVSSLLHLRLRRQLDYQQSVDQLGFRPKKSVDKALRNGNAGFG